LRSLEEAKKRHGSFVSLVKVDVRLSAAANARSYYAEGKAAKEKESKTLLAAEHAIKRAEQLVAESAAKHLAAASTVKSIRIARKPQWFERFFWFITTEGLLCVAGRNAQDNEQLVKKYLRSQDVYVHADTHGAASVILRSRSSDPTAVLLPPVSLIQAGQYCICLSTAWQAHATTAAWWVPASAVSKTAPSGEYIGTGSFMVRGRKTFLPPSKLELGVVVLFKVDESCTEAHLNDRRVKGGGGDVLDDVVSSMMGQGEDINAVVGGGGLTSSPPLSTKTPAKMKETLNTVTTQTFAGKASQKPQQSSATTSSKNKNGSGKGNKAMKTNDTNNDSSKGDRASSSNASSSLTSSIASVRGKKGKAKKAAKKYADQDDEDRIIAMRAMGHKNHQPLPPPLANAPLLQAGVALSKSIKIDAVDDDDDDDDDDNEEEVDERKGFEEEEEEEVVDEVLEKAVDDEDHPTDFLGEEENVDFAITDKEVTQSEEIEIPASGDIGLSVTPSSHVLETVDDKDDADIESKNPSSSSSSSSSSSVLTSKQTNTNVNEDDDTAALEGNNIGSGSGSSGGEQETRSLATLVSVPLPTDTLMFAVPMLAPWSVALQCKFRAKLVPGPLKKGKAGQAVLHEFIRQTKQLGAGQGPDGTTVTKREADLLKALGDTEIVQCIAGQCKIVLTNVNGGGGSKGGGGGRK
jgi:hypothetical protein